MSGGGFAALNIGLLHLDAFGTLLPAMPYDVPDNRRRLGEEPALAGTGAPGDVETARSIAEAFRSRGRQAAVHLDEGFGHTWRTAPSIAPLPARVRRQALRKPHG